MAEYVKKVLVLEGPPVEVAGPPKTLDRAAWRQYADAMGDTPEGRIARALISADVAEGWNPQPNRVYQQFTPTDARDRRTLSLDEALETHSGAYILRPLIVELARDFTRISLEDAIAASRADGRSEEEIQGGIEAYLTETAPKAEIMVARLLRTIIDKDPIAASEVLHGSNKQSRRIAKALIGTDKITNAPREAVWREARAAEQRARDEARKASSAAAAVALYDFDTFGKGYAGFKALMQDAAVVFRTKAPKAARIVIANVAQTRQVGFEFGNDLAAAVDALTPVNTPIYKVKRDLWVDDALQREAAPGTILPFYTQSRIAYYEAGKFDAYHYLPPGSRLAYVRRISLDRATFRKMENGAGHVNLRALWLED